MRGSLRPRLHGSVHLLVNQYGNAAPPQHVVFVAELLWVGVVRTLWGGAPDYVHWLVVLRPATTATRYG